MYNAFETNYFRQHIENSCVICMRCIYYHQKISFSNLITNSNRHELLENNFVAKQMRDNGDAVDRVDAQKYIQKKIRSCENSKYLNHIH